MSARPTTRVVLVPGVLALLPQYASLADPVADLRAACHGAVAWLGTSVRVLGDPQGRRVAEHLLATTPREGDDPSYLVVGNGSARRGERAPGHLDERSFAFDEALSSALRAGRLDGLDLSLADDLLASVDGIREVGAILDGSPAEVLLDADPYGVQYWVMRWTCGS